MELSEQNLKLFASAWAAPTWAVDNGKPYGGYLLKEYYQLWAEYYIKFFEEYQKYGILFWGVTTQNEPALGVINQLANALAWFPKHLVMCCNYYYYILFVLINIVVF